jgi:two-component system sensor histidine kinase BarA
MSDFRILVVEDNPVVRTLTQTQLAILGYQSEAVRTGEEAVSLHSRHSPDIVLILMDIGLPGLDGIQTTLLIREKELKEQCKRVPIIALTATLIRKAVYLRVWTIFCKSRPG